jgi:hypothetical protein
MERNMKRKLTLAVMTALLMIGFSSAAAYADTVTFTLTDSTAFVPGQTGGVATYDATVSAPNTNGATVFLNGDSFNVSAPLTLDDTDFFVNFPLSLAPGASFTGDLFTVSVPAGTAPGNYVGSFTILGGADGGAGDNLGTVNFSSVVTPEPSSLILLGSGFAGVFATIRRKRSSRA